MSLQAITKIKEVSAAYAEFARHFNEAGEALSRNVGYQGSAEAAEIRWYPEFKFWALLQPDRVPERYWSVFGVEDPNECSVLSVMCEINPPREGIDRRSTVVFVRSNNGTIYLAHNGRVGGGRAGVGKKSFLSFYGDYTVDEVTWPDGKVGNFIIIGALEDDDLLEAVGDFVGNIARYKNGEPLKTNVPA